MGDSPIGQLAQDVTVSTVARFGSGLCLGVMSPIAGLGILTAWAALEPHLTPKRSAVERSLDGVAGIVGLVIGRLER